MMMIKKSHDGELLIVSYNGLVGSALTSWAFQFMEWSRGGPRKKRRINTDIDFGI